MFYYNFFPATERAGSGFQETNRQVSGFSVEFTATGKTINPPTPPPPYALIHTVKSDTMNKHSLSVSLSHVADQVLGGVLARGKSNCMMAAYTNKHTHAYTGLLKTESAFSILFTSCL